MIQIYIAHSEPRWQCTITYEAHTQQKEMIKLISVMVIRGINPKTKKQIYFTAVNSEGKYSFVEKLSQFEGIFFNLS